MSDVNATCRKCAGQLLRCDKCAHVYCWACDGTGRSCPKCGTNNRADSPHRATALAVLLLAAAWLVPAWGHAGEDDYVSVVVKNTVWIVSVRTNFDSTSRLAAMTGSTVDNVITSTNAYHCETAVEKFAKYDSFAMGSMAPENRVIYFTSGKASCRKLLKEPSDQRDQIMMSVRVVKKLGEIPAEVQAAIRKKLGQ